MRHTAVRATAVFLVTQLCQPALPSTTDRAKEAEPLTAPGSKELQGHRKGQGQQPPKSVADLTALSTYTLCRTLSAPAGACMRTLMNQTLPSLTLSSKSAPSTCTCAETSAAAPENAQAASSTTHANNVVERLAAIVCVCVGWWRAEKGTEERAKVISRCKQIEGETELAGVCACGCVCCVLTAGCSTPDSFKLCASLFGVQFKN